MRWALVVLVAGLFAVVSLMPRTVESPRAGCLWDRDTLAQEAKGNELIVKAITGRFDRFEPVYYEARLRHLQPLLEAEPARLDLYDDVGVALDRLHRGDEAIAVMAGKRAQLDLLPEGSPERVEHEYRYLANLGTFHAHRWLRNGKDRGDLSDLQEAERLIAAAIELNPEAHFGRERYQLMAIRWLITPPAISESWDESSVFSGLDAPPVGALGLGNLESAGYSDAAEGIAGLIVLGDGWESIDLFVALMMALDDRGDGHLGAAARSRVTELLADPARSSLLPGFAGTIRTAWEELAKDDGFVEPADARRIRKWFAAARTEAEAWRASRNAFVERRVAEGTVPDMSKAFWMGWTETSTPPAMPSRVLPVSGDQLLLNAVLYGIPVLLLIGVAVWTMRRGS